MITVGKYIKRKTSDGTFELNDDVKIGDTRFVDLASIREAQFYNVNMHVYHTKLVINIVDRQRNILCLAPLELLEIRELDA